ncbi:MAG: hypothetical protein MHM6MM_000930 [Cercozoa sp. M6MM]
MPQRAQQWNTVPSRRRRRGPPSRGVSQRERTTVLREQQFELSAAEFEEHCEELQKRLNLLSDRLSEHAVFLDTVSALKNQIDLDKVRHVVCFGVGSPHLRFRVDGAQCAFALALSKACNDARIHYFDPASDKVDAHVLQAMGVFLLSNTHCVLDVVSAFDLHQDERVLLFMPHCNAPMYHNVLCSNWSHLNRIILLGNPLTRYLSDSSSHVAARSAGGISGTLS